MSKRKYFDTSKSVRLSTYRDQHFKGSHNEQEKRLLSSSTLYVGNLAFYTREEQIHELFSRAGDVKRIVMGLDNVRRTPCGFCFVEFYTRPDAENAMRYVNGTRLDDRVVRTDWDVGFQEGRQYGRGKSGGQVRDEYRVDYDPGRGGYGKIIMQKMGQDDRMFTEPSVPVPSTSTASATTAPVAAAPSVATPAAAGAAAVTTAAP